MPEDSLRPDGPSSSAAKISRILRFLEGRRARWDRQCGEALDAIVEAATATQNYSNILKACKSQAERDNVPEEAPILSQLWATAASKVGRVDEGLAKDCDFKAFGWKTRWQFDEDVRRSHRKAGAIVNDALELQRKQPPTSSFPTVKFE